MDKGLKWFLALAIGGAACGCGWGVGEDMAAASPEPLKPKLEPVCATACDVDTPSPDPFTPKKLEKEGRGATMRHAFHKMRTTWDDYFKVWPGPKENHESITLQKIRSEPKFFLHRQVEFNVYFNKRGSFFRQLVTPFHRDTYVNFNAWPIGIDLWDREQRVDIFPFLYVMRQNDKLIRKMDAYAPYTPMHLWGEVTVVSEGYPWITVTNMEPLKETVHSLAALRDLEIGFQRMDKKDWTLALDAFVAVTEKGLPDNSQIKTYEAMVNCLMNLHRYGRAREQAIKALELFGTPRVQLNDILEAQDKRPVRTLVLLAKCDLALGYHDEAREAAELAVKLEYSNAVAHAELGLAWAKMGDLHQGMWEIDAAQRLAPDGRLAEAFRNRAQVYIQQGRWEDARKELNEAITQRLNSDQYHYEQGDVYLALNNAEKAQLEFEASARLAPDLPEPLYKLAFALKARGDEAAAAGKKEDAGKFYAQALEAVEKCHQKDDRFAPAYGLHAELLRAVGKPDDAKKLLERGLKTSSKDLSMYEVLYGEAKAQGDWQGMEEASMAAVLLKPNHPGLHLRLADVRASKPSPDYGGAEGEYAVVVKLDPRNAEAWGRLAHMRRSLGWWAQGAAAGEEAVRLNRENYYNWADLAECRRQNGDAPGAKEAAEQAARLQNSVAARINLAVACLDRNEPGDAAQALALARQAAAEAKTDDEKANANSALAAALFLSGQNEEAKNLFTAADGSLKDNAWHNLWAARSAWHSGDFAGAQARFTQARELSLAQSAGSKLMLRLAEDATRGMQDVAKAEQKAGSENVLSRTAAGKEPEKVESKPVVAEKTPETSTPEAKEEPKTETAKEEKKTEDTAKPNVPPVVETNDPSAKQPGGTTKVESR